MSSDGASKSSAIQTWLRHPPSCRFFNSGCQATSMAIGLPALQITIVSPAAASSSNRESCVLAYCTFTVFTLDQVWSGLPDCQLGRWIAPAVNASVTSASSRLTSKSYAWAFAFASRSPSKYLPVTPSKAGSTTNRIVASKPSSTVLITLQPASKTSFVGISDAG